jgi:hypothetical protein
LVARSRPDQGDLFGIAPPSASRTKALAQFRAALGYLAAGSQAPGRPDRSAVRRAMPAAGRPAAVTTPATEPAAGLDLAATG